MRRTGMVCERRLEQPSDVVPKLLARAERIFGEAIGHDGPGRDIGEVMPYGARSDAMVLAMTVTRRESKSATTRSVSGSFTPCRSG